MQNCYLNMVTVLSQCRLDLNLISESSDVTYVVWSHTANSSQIIGVKLSKINIANHFPLFYNRLFHNSGQLPIG